MSNQQTVYADQEQGLGAIDPITQAALINFASQIVPGLFGGGKQDAKKRDRMREELSKIGFNWIPTSGVPAGQEWNIDNWPDVSLINIGNATAKHGQIVPQLHNQQKFNPANTASMSQIEFVIRSNGGSLNQGPGSSTNFIPSWGNQGAVTQNGSNNANSSSFGQFGVWPMVLLGAGALGLVVSMKNSKPVKGK